MRAATPFHHTCPALCTPHATSCKPGCATPSPSPPPHNCVQVRKYIQSIVKPGLSLTELCETLEDSVRALIEARGLDAGERAGVRVIE